MAITTGQTASANDFIDSSTNAGDATDNGKVAKLEEVDGEDGRIAKEFLPADTVYRASKKVEVDATEVTVISTNVETALFDTTIAANRLGSNNALRVTVYISSLKVANNGKSVTLRLKLGSTTIATLVLTTTAATGSNLDIAGELVGYIVADGATNAQKGALRFVGGDGVIEQDNLASVDGNKGIGAIGGSAAEDTTASKTLTLTAQNSESTTTTGITAEFWIVEEIAA